MSLKTTVFRVIKDTFPLWSASFALVFFVCLVVSRRFFEMELEYGGRNSNSSLLVCTVFRGCECAGFSTAAGLQSWWSFLSQR